MKQPKNGDVEGGMAKKPKNNEGISAGTIVAIILAILILAAACAVSWIYEGWQTSLLVFACLLIVYAFAFNWRWWYIAFCTAYRDFS